MQKGCIPTTASCHRAVPIRSAEESGREIPHVSRKTSEVPGGSEARSHIPVRISRVSHRKPQGPARFADQTHHRGTRMLSLQKGEQRRDGAAPRLRDARGTPESLRLEGEFQVTVTYPAMAPFQSCVPYDRNLSQTLRLCIRWRGRGAILPTTVIRLKWILHRRTFPAGV